MTIEQALAINGLYVRLLYDFGETGHKSVSGRVVGVCVPCPGSPVEAHLLIDLGRGCPIPPCGAGSELFLSSISRLLYSGEKPSEPIPPALSLVVGAWVNMQALSGAKCGVLTHAPLLRNLLVSSKV